MIKHLTDDLLLSLLSLLIMVWVLTEQRFDDSNPILLQDIATYLMGVHIVGTESLHAEIVNEAISFNTIHLIGYLEIVYLNRDES